MTASSAPVEEHAVPLPVMVPVTETVAPAVRSVVRVALAWKPVETKMGDVLPLAENTKPSTDPLPE